jgi:hypothetical protein
VRIGERSRVALDGVVRELGRVTRDAWGELELRVARLGHRLRLLEASTDGSASGPRH